jgi:exodeoxyribonuclease VII large subunit
MQQQSPLAKTQRYEQQQLFYTDRLQRTFKQLLYQASQRLEGFNRSLTALNPSSVLERGFTLIEGGDGIITSIDHVQTNDHVSIRFKDGVAESTITTKRRN